MSESRGGESRTLYSNYTPSYNSYGESRGGNQEIHSRFQVLENQEKMEEAEIVIHLQNLELKKQKVQISEKLEVK